LPFSTINDAALRTLQMLMLPYKFSLVRKVTVVLVMSINQSIIKP